MMVKLKDVLGVLLTTIILAAVVAGGFSPLSVALASAIVLLSIINLVPWISGKQQQYVIVGLTLLVLAVMFVRFAGDPVIVSLSIGGVVGLALLVVKGPEFRWSAIGILALAVLISAGLAALLGRVTTAFTLLAMDVLGLASTKLYWQTQ